jgi:hypothetical protein
MFSLVYGFHAEQAYSSDGRTRDLYASSLTVTVAELILIFLRRNPSVLLAFVVRDNTRVRIIFLSRKALIFFPEFNIRLYDKNSESDYFFFPPPKSEYFFQQHWESEYFFRKKP